MTSQECLNCNKLRDAFEGREAIYIEKGVPRVRVENVRCNVRARTIDAEVEEVPIRGLERSLFHRSRNNQPSPLRWSIGAGYLTTFSNNEWHMGYGGWPLFFAPEVVAAFISIASAWTSELDAVDRYDEAVRFLEDQGERLEPVFSD